MSGQLPQRDRQHDLPRTLRPPTDIFDRFQPALVATGFDEEFPKFWTDGLKCAKHRLARLYKLVHPRCETIVSITGRCPNFCVNRQSGCNVGHCIGAEIICSKTFSCCELRLRNQRLTGCTRALTKPAEYGSSTFRKVQCVQAIRLAHLLWGARLTIADCVQQ